MRVHFGQIYIQPNVTFPFSNRLQRRLAERVSGLVAASATFTSKYGPDWDLMFRISAKTDIGENEIRGPTVFTKEKDVEYTIFLPFDIIANTDCVPQLALQFLLEGCCHVLRGIDIDPAALEEAMEPMIESICSDPQMFM